ncbi:MAG: ABC transporter permease [Bacteroidales bacterium]|nr:ABC transporter permease [Bacteroidales bacterium]
MFIKNLILATRIIVRQKVHTAVNILGLAFGIAVSILIFLWVMNELSYDRFFPNGDRIYKVLTKDSSNVDVLWIASPFPLAPSLFNLYPEVVDYTRFWEGSVLVKYKDKPYYSQNMALVDPGFFSIFSIEFIAGNPETALSDLSNAVITEKVARDIFGDEDPMGKVLYLESHPITITGVIKDPPRNSHLQYSALGHIGNVPELRLNSWYYAGPSYILVQEGKRKDEVEQAIFDFYRTMDPETGGYPCLQNVEEIYLNENGKPGRIRHVYLFSFIGILILVIACMNYINLSTARFTRRVKEIGIRKVLGASRSQIIRMFLGEVVSVVFISLFIALILVELIRPLFNAYTGRELIIQYTDPVFMSAIICIGIFTSIISGVYPALSGSSLNAVDILKGKLARGLKGKQVRSALIVFQYVISVSLIISTIYANKQLKYTRNIGLGYQYEQIVTLPYNSDLEKSFDAFREELLKNPMILNVSASSLLPNDVNWIVSLDWPDNPDDQGVPINYLTADYEFIETMGMELVSGRSFSRSFPSDDSISYIVNETAVKAMGLTDPVGARVEFIHNEFPERFRKGYIVGVVKDFYFRPLRESSGAFAMRIYRPWYNYVLIKVNLTDIPGVLSYIEQVTHQYAPDYPFEYQFFDESFDEVYKSETKISVLFKYFAVIAILLSILGLYGLSSFSAENRTQEIAIRKVNGGTLHSILRMLLFDFSKQVLLAIAISIPVSLFIITRMMQNYAHHAPVSWWIFVVAAFSALIISLLTVYYHALSISRKNPVESLRYE